MHHLVARHRPDTARHRAVHARDRRADRRMGRRHRARAAPCPSPTSCRASPVTSVPTPRAAVLQEGPHRGDDVMLLVDVGTNVEIVLGQPSTGSLAASSPTGPAFEGAQLACGQRATTGAIERVRIDRRRSNRASRSSGPTRGRTSPPSTGRGHRHHRRLRLGNHRGDRGAVPRRRDSSRRHDRRRARRRARRGIVPDGRTFAYVLHTGEPGSCASRRTTCRQIQLAKAALHAGVRCSWSATGSATSTRSGSPARSGAISIRCTRRARPDPRCDPAIVTPVGNAAGNGSRSRCSTASTRAEIEDVVRRIEKIETAIEPLPGALRRSDGDPALDRAVTVAARVTYRSLPPTRVERAGPPAAPSQSPEPAAEGLRMTGRRTGMTETNRRRRARGRAARQAARAIPKRSASQSPARRSRSRCCPRSTSR